MPIFEYLCKTCDSDFEALVHSGQTPACPSCEGVELEKKFSAFAVSGPSTQLAAREPIGPCGTCGDPRGAGACSLD